MIESTSSEGAARYPSRHPVIEYAFENPLTVTVRSRIDSRAARLRWAWPS
jgi:hypothetical protein